MAEKSLNARLSATDGISDALDSISSSAASAATSISGVSAEAAQASQNLERLQEKGEDVSDALSGITDDSGAAAGSLKVVEERVEETADEMSEGAAAAETYQSALSNWGAGGVVAQNQAIASSIDEVGDESTESTAEILGYRAALSSLSSFSFPSLQDREASVDFDAEDTDALDKISRKLNSVSGEREASVDLDVDDSRWSFLKDLDTPDASDAAASQSTIDDWGDSGDVDFENIWDTFDGDDFTFQDFDTPDATDTAAEASQPLRGEGVRSDGGGFASNMRSRMSGFWERGDDTDTIESFGVELGEEDVKRIQEVSDSFDTIPDNVRQTSGSLSEVANRTEKAKEEAREFSERLDSFDGFTSDQFDELVKGSSNIDELEYKTRQIDENLADDLFGDMSTDSRDMVDASFAGETDIQNTRRFKNQINETGDEATETAGEMSAANAAVSAWITNAMLGRSATSSFAREVDELGDEMTETTAKGVAMNELLEDLAGANVNFGPMNLSLARMAQLLPAIIAMMGSLVSVASGFALGGLGAGAGLGTILGGGAWFMGEQIAAGDPDIAGPMEGLQELGSRIRPELENALQPLKQAEFGTLFMDTLEGAIAFIGDLATSFSRLSTVLIPFFERIGAKFWQQQPEFFAEMEKLIVAMLPYVEDFIVYFLNNMPDALAFVREEATKLIPVWGDFLTSIVDLFAVLSRLGGVIFNLILPPLTLLADLATSILGPIVTVLAPAVEALAAAFSWLADVVWPVLKPFAQVIGIALVLTKGIGLLSTAAAVLASVITGSVIPALTSLLLSNPLGWIALAVGAIVVLLDHFGLLDDVMGWITGLFGDLANAVEEFFKNLDEGVIPALAELKSDLENIAGEYLVDIVVSLPGGEAIKDASQESDEVLPESSKDLGFGEKLASTYIHQASLGAFGKKYPLIGDGPAKSGGLLSGLADSGGVRGGSNQNLNERERNNSNIGTQEDLGGGDTNVNIYSNSDNPRRLGKIARREVEKANEESRKRTGSGN